MASYVAAFVGGLVACYLLISLGVVDRLDGLPGSQQEPSLSLPTYFSFLGVMLTALTAVLATLAIGIGVVAAFTFRGIKDEVQKTVDAKAQEVDEKVAKALTEVDRRTAEALSEDAINERIDRIAMAQRQTPTVAELEEDFDVEDDGNR